MPTLKKLRITNLDPHLEYSGEAVAGVRGEILGNCRGRAAKHVAALGIYSSDQTEAALIRENQSACFSL